MSSVSHCVPTYLLAFSLAWSLGCAPPPHRLTKTTLALVHGIQAFNHEDYQKALEYFGRAGGHRPKDAEVMYWRARTHFELGEFEKAVAWFEKSLDAATLERPRTEVQAHLDQARRALGSRAQPATTPARESPSLVLPEWSGFPRAKTRFSTDIGSDSNPALLPDEIAAGAEERFEGSQAVGNAALLAELYPLTGRRGRTLELSLEGRRSFHADDSELDLTQARGLVQFAWGKHPLGYLTGPLGTLRVPSEKTPYSFLAQLSTLYSEQDGDKLYSATQVAMSAVRAGTKTALQFDVAHQDFDFGRDFSALDGSQTLLRISETFLFRGDQREGGRIYPRLQYLRLHLGTVRRNAARELENRFHEGGFEASLRLAHRRYFQLAGALRVADFDHSDREDTAWQASAAFVQTLRPTLHLTARVTYGERDSNDPLSTFDYEQLRTSLGLAWYFQ